MVTVIVTCKKCKWKTDYGTDGSMEDVEKYWTDYNKEHEKDMDCVHEYQFKERVTFLKSN